MALDQTGLQTSNYDFHYFIVAGLAFKPFTPSFSKRFKQTDFSKEVKCLLIGIETGI